MYVQHFSAQLQYLPFHQRKYGSALFFLLLLYCCFYSFTTRFLQLRLMKALRRQQEQKRTFITIIIAVIVVLAMNLVGSLLISALIIFPALSAMRMFRSFRSVVICSVCLSVICTFVGIIISILAGTPVGSTIVAIDIAVFLIFYVSSLVCGRRN